MDPNEALRQLRNAASRFDTAKRQLSGMWYREDADQSDEWSAQFEKIRAEVDREADAMWEHFVDLDDWIYMNGSLPLEWQDK